MAADGVDQLFSPHILIIKQNEALGNFAPFANSREIKTLWASQSIYSRNEKTHDNHITRSYCLWWRTFISSFFSILRTALQLYFKSFSRESLKGESILNDTRRARASGDVSWFSTVAYTTLRVDGNTANTHATTSANQLRTSASLAVARIIYYAHYFYSANIHKFSGRKASPSDILLLSR